jgi:hypothetical protein
MHSKANAPLDHSTTRILLRPSEQDYIQAEDYKHSWLAHLSQNREGHLVNSFAELSITHSNIPAKPLLRVYDTFSGSIPDHSSKNRMLARLPRAELATHDARKTSLAIHADNGNWTDTPYISFTSRPGAASDLAEFRRLKRPKRGDQYLVAIDPRHRLRRGLPILDMKQEMEAYGVDNPYGYDYYTDHYVCLWEVTPGEIIRIWSWNDLRKDEDWYENIVVPAFQRHGTTQQDATDVDALASTLSRTHIGREFALGSTS